MVLQQASPQVGDRLAHDKKNRDSSGLLWDCFVNWAETLEKIDDGKSKTRGV